MVIKISVIWIFARCSLDAVYRDESGFRNFSFLTFIFALLMPNSFSNNHLRKITLSIQRNSSNLAHHSSTIQAPFENHSRTIRGPFENHWRYGETNHENFPPAIAKAIVFL
ncbi:MAG: hypothetical protein LUQ65_01390 [Candidatus Helarchaeota archaeon]|nr:hypothetical protein [Candidatus Helarchaeota archaeon]